MGKRGPKPRFLEWHAQMSNVPLFGITGKGNVTCYGTYVIDSGKVRKYICHTCGTRFCDRTNTAFYDLRTNEDKVRLALEMVMKGMSINGIAEVLKSKPSTVRSWISKASDHCEKVNNVILNDVETSKVEMDELWTFVGEKEGPKDDKYDDDGTWIWIGMAAETRLVLSHVVGERSQKSADRLAKRTAQCLKAFPLFVTEAVCPKDTQGPR